MKVVLGFFFSHFTVLFSKWQENAAPQKSAILIKSDRRAVSKCGFAHLPRILAYDPNAALHRRQRADARSDLIALSIKSVKKRAALPDGKTARSARPFVPHIRRNGRSKTQSDPQHIGSSAPYVFRAKVYSSSEALSVFLPEGGFLTIPITTSKAITAEHISLTYGTSAPNCPATSAIALAADIQNS